MNKYLYLIKKLQIKPWIKYWLVNKEKKKLPDTYQQVEYLESSGAQYIDTGRVPNNNDIIEQKFQSKNNTTETIAWYGSMPR